MQRLPLRAVLRVRSQAPKRRMPERWRRAPSVPVLQRVGAVAAAQEPGALPARSVPPAREPRREAVARWDRVRGSRARCRGARAEAAAARSACLGQGSVAWVRAPWPAVSAAGGWRGWQRSPSVHPTTALPASEVRVFPRAPATPWPRLPHAKNTTRDACASRVGRFTWSRPTGGRSRFRRPQPSFPPSCAHRRGCRRT